MSSTTSTPACSGNPAACSFCGPSADKAACAIATIPGCTSAPGNCPVCATGKGCAKDCTGVPSSCTACETSCIKPAEINSGIEPARPTTSTPACSGNPASCSFCGPSSEAADCAKTAIPGCTSAPGNCPVCANGEGCAKDCTGNPSSCKACKSSCIKPSTASSGIEPARPKAL